VAAADDVGRRPAVNERRETMKHNTPSINMNRTVHLSRAVLSLLALVSTGCAVSHGEAFSTPEEAVSALGTCLAEENDARYDVVFGPGALDLLRSGDPVADKADAARIKAMIDEQVAVEYLDDTTALLFLGHDEWPFAVPLVKHNAGWRFDLEKGREEIANRRVGRNELTTIAALRELVNAQREYRAEGRDGNPAAFASRLISEPGKRNGLYWETADGEPTSPMGPFVAQAALEGYTANNEEPAPFHGYFYRLLTRQGAHAPGGARNYENESGLLTGGFAAIAWPATPGVSGVMTFMVSDRGIVFEKDFGDKTADVVAKIDSYDPDDSWSLVVDTP
jgi:Protein of unknown function (DUF2950)